MSKIRILAVEDDPIHEDKLRMVMDMLAYDLIDVLPDPSRLMPLISATKPDILLMDIDLSNNMSGIDLVKKINEIHDIPTVYLTSFTDDVTFNEAKKTLPAAYITKPYKAEELQRAVELAVLARQHDQFNSANQLYQINSRENFFIKNGNTLTKISISAISLIKAYDKYCYIFTPEEKFMLKGRLKNILSHLPASQFCQVHRSYVVNISAIESIDMKNNNILVMGKTIGIGKTYKQNLFTNVSLLG